MTITTRAQVRAAFERALQLGGDREAAIEAAAQALGLPVEAVREAVEGETA
jgi:hypothetical protein